MKHQQANDHFLQQLKTQLEGNRALLVLTLSVDREGAIIINGIPSLPKEHVVQMLQDAIEVLTDEQGDRNG